MKIIAQCIVGLFLGLLKSRAETAIVVWFLIMDTIGLLIFLRDCFGFQEEIIQLLFESGAFLNQRLAFYVSTDFFEGYQIRKRSADSSRVLEDTLRRLLDTGFTYISNFYAVPPHSQEEDDSERARCEISSRECCPDGGKVFQGFTHFTSLNTKMSHLHHRSAICHLRSDREHLHAKSN